MTSHNTECRFGMVSDRDAWNRWDECLTIAVEKIDPKIGESMPFRFSDFSDDWAGLLVESYTAEAETLISVGVIFFFWIFQFWLNMSWAQRGSVKLWRPQSLHMTSLFHSYTMWFRCHNEETSTTKSKIAQGLSLTGHQLGWYIRICSKM